MLIILFPFQEIIFSIQTCFSPAFFWERILNFSYNNVEMRFTNNSAVFILEGFDWSFSKENLN
jgi:hypothetical protein